MTSPHQDNNDKDNTKTNQSPNSGQNKLLDEAELERQYRTHREAFEKWKEENKKVEATATYQNYVKQFEAWEEEVEKRRQAIRARIAAADKEETSGKLAQAQPGTSTQHYNTHDSGNIPDYSNSSHQNSSENPVMGPANQDGTGVDPNAFMMGMMSMMSMMLFDPLSMAINGDNSTENKKQQEQGVSATGTENNPIFSQYSSAPTSSSGSQGFVAQSPAEGGNSAQKITHAQAQQELAARQRERDYEARAGRTGSGPLHLQQTQYAPPPFVGPPNTSVPPPQNPGYGGYYEPQQPVVGPDYGYGGSGSMWGGHETAAEMNDPMFKKWGHRADPPSKGPAPSYMYDFNVQPYPPPQGTILPPGWVQEEPIRKERRVPPPPREYRGGRPAFRDFSMR